MTIPQESTVGEGIVAGNAAWSFAGSTAQAFPEHVRRSVPLYEEGHDVVCKLSDFFVRDDSLVYEFGTSVGELLAKLADRHAHRHGARWIGLDTEPDMVAQARDAIAGRAGVSLEVADVVTHDLEPSDLIVSYYCLQFIAPKHRQNVVNQIHESLNWGGAFIWFEKVRACDARFQDIVSALYVDYKLEQQYTCDQIVAKSRSLKGVLEPFSTEGNRGLLQRAGFVDVITVFKYLCFEGVLAIK
jgi:tRNA (cmo5U34)-methyltransferase